MRKADININSVGSVIAEPPPCITPIPHGAPERVKFGQRPAAPMRRNVDGADVDALAGYSSRLRGWAFWGLP